MPRIKEGFKGERAIVLPAFLIEELKQDPLGSELYITDIGYVAQDVKIMGNPPVKVVMSDCLLYTSDTTSNPDYQLQCIFARMLGGGIDYTPGSMRNSTFEKFKPIDPGLPSSLGTRSHALALFVVLSAPFASLCDSPD